MSTATLAPEVESPPDETAREPEPRKGFEFVNGQLRELNVSAKSSRIGGRLYRRLDEYCDTHSGWAFPAETSFRCFPDDKTRYRKPDAAFIALDRFTPEQYDTEGHISVCPDVVVEVTSPNDLSYDVNEKRQEWLRAGVRVVWVIDPKEKTIHAYRADGSVTLLRETDTLTGDPVLPGFAVPVAELFRLPVPHPPQGG
ncbi:MAG: hypothetical protein JWO38_4163 [Gemmataceae bacterium]|nr:hypothetical protein [Gemmataceae bacterium]